MVWGFPAAERASYSAGETLFHVCRDTALRENKSHFFEIGDKDPAVIWAWPLPFVWALPWAVLFLVLHSRLVDDDLVEGAGDDEVPEKSANIVVIAHNFAGRD